MKLKIIIFCFGLVVISTCLIIAHRDLSVFPAYTPEQTAVVYGCLNAPDTTTITTAGDYYQINGTFANTLDGWGLVSGCYAYNLNKPRRFVILWATSLSANRQFTNVFIAVRVNGVVREMQRMGTRCFSLNEPYSFSGIDSLLVADGDDVDLVITSDGSGDIITVGNLAVAIFSVDS